MPPSANMHILIQFMVLISVIDELVGLYELRATWDWGTSHIVSIYDYIAYDDDFRILSRMTFNTFDMLNERCYDYLKWPKQWFKTGNITIEGNYTGRRQECVLSPQDRLLRFLMLNNGYKIPQLEATFGQKKSTIYDDYKFISIQIVFAMGDEWLSLPEPGSVEYNGLIGAGVFSENGEILFDNIPYIADVTSIRIQRPKYGQRAYYNGHKKYHTVDFHCVHSGTGRVYSVSGPIPGANNDIQSARTSPVYTHRNQYLAPGHGVFADLAYYYVGQPFVCRVAYQPHYTAIENTYNLYHSKTRVISENWYGRFKLYWGYWMKPWAMSLEDVGMAFRAMAIVTNLIITVQDPLRQSE